MNKIDKNTYSVKTSYALGDKYRMDKNYLAAELCYALPLIGDHIINRRESADINPRKLHDLMLYRQQIRYVPPSKGKDIAELLPFIRSFYKSWQQEIIKPDMITRSEIHAQFRKQAVIKVFKEATKKYNLADKLDFIALDNIASDTHNQQLEKIDNWMGPSFSKLQYKKSGKTSKSKRGSNKISQLTVVMDCKKYRKRCLNSQEDWFKKFDGVFFARCLKSILEIINDNIMNENDRKFIKLKFAKRILARKIQFKSASAKLLIPAGTLFACKELMSALHEYHTKLDAASIKQASKCTVKVMHQKLMKAINIEYNKVCNECNIFDDDISEFHNAALTFEVDDDPKTTSASTTSSCSVELKAEPMNDNEWLLKNESMFIGNNNNMNNMNNQSMMPIVTNFVSMDNNNNQSMMPLGNGICSWTGIDEVDDGEDIHDNQPDYDHNVMPTPFLPQRAYNGRLSGVSSPDDIAETETKYNDDPYHQIQVPCNPQMLSNGNEEILCNPENYRWQLDIPNQPQTNATNTSDCNIVNNGDCFYTEQQCQQQIHQEQINCNQMKNNFDCSFFNCNYNNSNNNNYDNNNYNNNYNNNNNNNNLSRGTSVAMSSDGSTEYSVNSNIYRGNQQQQQQQQQQRSCQSSQFCQYQQSNSYQQPQLYQQISNSTSSGQSSPGTDFETSQVSLPSYNSSHCMNNNNYNNYNKTNDGNNNAFVDSPPSFMKPSFIKPLCVDCGEQECRCNDNSNNHQRAFQATNNFLNPNSYRIHQEINHNNNRNNRNQRRSQHIEEMRYNLINNMNNNLNNLYNNNNMNNVNWM